MRVLRLLAFVATIMLAACSGGSGDTATASVGADASGTQVSGAAGSDASDAADATFTGNDGNSRFTLFESSQVRPLALSPDGTTLYAVNTPDGTLEMYRVHEQGLKHVASIAVGLEPVAVAVRDRDEVWVVNHLSDSVSIVDVRDGVRRVVRTLLVGDEPRDIVFAGAARNRAFVTTAHRGQNTGYDPELSKPGIGRADVWVFDADKVRYDESLGGKPLTVISLFMDTPRALAASPDGARVYAAGFLSGNRTTVIPEEVVTLNGGLPPPQKNIEGQQQPGTGLIVKYDGQHWKDSAGRVWDKFVKFSLPDKDVFVIDANAAVPKQIDGAHGFYSGVGTVIQNLAVNPRTGQLLASNTEAMNDKRFEGPGTIAGQTVRGHLHESRITILERSGEVKPRHLNKHINYAICCAPQPNAESERSLAMPTGMAITDDGKVVYVAAFGSSKVGIFSAAALNDDSFTPNARDHITVSGGGPSGLALDETRGRLYVLTRFNNAIAIVDTAQRREVASVTMHNPEPQRIVNGRRFLYDATLSSSHGDSSCASCHVGADNDGLAWDLGNPDGMQINNPGPLTLAPATVGSNQSIHFQPMKGPMTTQSLRGMANHGPMHWRGDRTGGNSAASAQPDSGTFDEVAAFKKFDEAFHDLLGRDSKLNDEQMKEFTDFVLQISYPPNPIRNLDNSLTASQQAGRDFYFNRISDRLFACAGCHVLNPKGNAEFGVDKPGFFGTDGSYSFEFETQVFKIPHLRNLYTKVGMFGVPPTSNLLSDSPDGTNAYMGDQVRGFGFLHDGSTDTVFRFLTSNLFRHIPTNGPDPGNPGGFVAGPSGEQQRHEVESFIMAYDSNLAPIVGQQVTLTLRNAKQANPRIDLLMARADAGECDLVARRSVRRAYRYVGNGYFEGTLSGGRYISDAALREKVQKFGIETTYTCAPPGSAARMARSFDPKGAADADGPDL
jgi:DNA-binding beta-propeller fold protein YncE/cytochrome c peroxidase